MQLAGSDVVHALATLSTVEGHQSIELT